jgi:hypothetical protein
MGEDLTLFDTFIAICESVLLLLSIVVVFQSRSKLGCGWHKPTLI